MFFIPKVARQVSRMFHSTDITELMTDPLVNELRKNSERQDRSTSKSAKRS